MESHHKSGRVTADSDSKRVLVLGAGFVAGPVVQYFSNDANVYITLGLQIFYTYSRRNKLVNTVVQKGVGVSWMVEDERDEKCYGMIF